MQARFLLGPAGSGKTFRCLAEIRAELLRAPDGPPLLFLSPKQATFQLERQLLGDGLLAGYTRLQILSFDRLAQFVLDQLNPTPPDWLDDEGRVMVLRALLARQRDELRLFHASARLPGFATHLSQLLRELQRHQLSPGQLRKFAEKISDPAQLRDKLRDFALLLESYQRWLVAHDLQDTDCRLDLAAQVLTSGAQAARPEFRLAGLWMDGFAELTTQELALLAAVMPGCERATLAFCLPAELTDEPAWLSPWAVIGQTFLRCRERLAVIPGVSVSVEILSRDPTIHRFRAAPELAHLEAHWSAPVACADQSPPRCLNPAAADVNPLRVDSGKSQSRLVLAAPDPGDKAGEALPQFHSLQGFRCPNPEAEAVMAAREIVRFVQAGGRYREAAVLLRSLEDYAPVLRRVFARYDIPCFLDQREPVAHHPLAELSRCALRTLAFRWRPADWFGALKTGLVPLRAEEVDWLENLALEHGWEGDVWLNPLALPDRPHDAERLERLRQKALPPFATLIQQAGPTPTGAQLAAALRTFWKALQVTKTLEAWTDSTVLRASPLTPHASLHSTVWEQMLAWLDNLARAFPEEALPLREWLPILEAGLANLTVGVIPPALDQVLIGAVDRSRNPDLKLALVLGLNEGVFPAPPAEDPLLNEIERDALQTIGARLGPGARRRLGHEWFYGYIAVTRASERVVLSCSRVSFQGEPLNLSAFWARLEKLFPVLKLEDWQPPGGFDDAWHVSEIVAPAIQVQACAPAEAPAPPIAQLLQLPALTPILTRAREVTAALAASRLAPDSVEALFGRELATSVSALENFAACPFKFFVSHGLRAKERREFELDARQRGSFQHEVLKQFHEQVMADHRQWRDLAPAEARLRVRAICEALLPTYENGMFAANAARRFEGELLAGALETFIGVLITWARDYRFDPTLVEAGFGLRKPGDWPAWRLELEPGRALLLRGRLDRVDVQRDAASTITRFVVMDYKSASRAPDPLKLHHGLQLQLPLYLAALEQIPEAAAALGAGQLQAAGAFYVNLRGQFASASSRAEALADAEAAFRQAFQHIGRYDAALRAQLDPHDRHEQFRSPKTNNCCASEEFRAFIEQAVAHLRRFGREIFQGVIAPAPYRKSRETACQQCEYRSICRFDPWTQPFRALPRPPKPGGSPTNDPAPSTPKPKRAARKRPSSSGQA